MFTETSKRQVQRLKPLRVFWENKRQDKAVTPLLLRPLAEELLLQSPWGPARQENSVHTHTGSSSSLRTGQATGKIAFITDQCMGSTVCRENGRVQCKTSLCSQFDCTPCLTAAPRNSYDLHRHTWIGRGIHFTLPCIRIELGEVFLSHQH